jgi:hypothetical protein
MPLKCTAVLARPFVLLGKLCFRGIQRGKNNKSNLQHALIFSLEIMKKKVLRKFEVIWYIGEIMASCQEIL